MYPLMVPGGVRELVDLILIDDEPVAGPELGANQARQIRYLIQSASRDAGFTAVLSRAPHRLLERCTP